MVTEIVCSDNRNDATTVTECVTKTESQLPQIGSNVFYVLCLNN